MKNTKHNPEPLPRLFLRVDEAAMVLGIGRSKLYELIKTDAIRTVRIGRAVRIPYSAVQEFADRVEADGDLNAPSPDR